MAVDVERRKASRYSLRIPVMFSWRDFDNSTRQGGGVSRDLSIAGAYVVCEPDECPPADMEVLVRIFLPPLEGGKHGIQLQSVGRVTRRTKVDEDAGFVVEAKLALHSRQFAVDSCS